VIRSTAAALFVSVCVCIAGCSPKVVREPAPVGHGPVVRVLLDEAAGPFTVTCGGGFHVEAEGGAVVTRSNTSSTITIGAAGGSLQILLNPQGSSAAVEGEAYITPFRSGSLVYAGVTYGGRILVQAGESNKLRLINVVPLEVYLEGVLPHEMGDPGPDGFAALEAQAVAARTYAMKRMEARVGEVFDVYASVQDQLYRGMTGTNRLASGAVRETRGMVLMYDGRLAGTYYCATCGGHTSDIRPVWPHRESGAYLRGVLDRAPGERESFCAGARNFRWSYAFTGRELGRILRRTIPSELGVPADRVGTLVDLRIAERSESGRVRKLEIVTSQGTYGAEADRIRWVLALDPDRGTILPSTMFELRKEMRDGRLAYITVVGGGNGHGVGMCQNGAIKMARRGYPYDVILAHYYPGTKLVRRY
jgi:stage II sporulation protein D